MYALVQETQGRGFSDEPSGAPGKMTQPASDPLRIRFTCSELEDKVRQFATWLRKALPGPANADVGLRRQRPATPLLAPKPVALKDLGAQYS